MKTLITLLLIICGLSGSAQTCYVRTGPLKLYAQLGADQKVMALLPVGQKVQLIPETEKNGWVKVLFNETEGYVSRNAIHCGDRTMTQHNQVSASKVWICLGNTAYAYHRSNSCSGLNRCKAKIIAVGEQEAKMTYRRRSCQKCY